MKAFITRAYFLARGPFAGVLNGLANVAIIAVAMVLIWQVFHNREAIDNTAYLKVGDTSPVVFSGQKPTLAIVMSENCHFCKESVPFYRRLPRGDVRVVVLMPQKETGEAYLRSEGLDFPVVLMDMQTMRIHGTPTLVLVNPNGKVARVWPGKLSPAAERDVLATVAMKGTK